SRYTFDYDASTNTVTAKARYAFDSYGVGDPIPFFTADHVGKELSISGARMTTGGYRQLLRGTIASVAGDGTTATITVPPGVTDATVVNSPASFLPVQATTTADSTTVSLSAPILVGRGEADMVGHFVSIPKAQSKVNPDLDLFTSRVAAVSDGDDSNGYSTIILTEAP